MHDDPEHEVPRFIPAPDIADELSKMEVPEGYQLNLFSADPILTNPINLNWDTRGRAWVSMSSTYPHIKPGTEPNDRIVILEDQNQNGVADKWTVFADGLLVPHSVMPVKGGAYVCSATELLFLADTDGDDRADTREVLFTGWGVGDTHAGPSNLRYGFDNWIYGTVGYARFNGTIGGEKHNFGMGVFRFRSDGSDIEFLHQFNNNTWGMGFNAAGDVFGSTANNNPTFFGGIPATVYSGDKKMSAKMIADSRYFHPITPNIRQVDAFNAYTAGCGHAFGTSAGFPKKYRNGTAFVCGPTGNLLGTYRMEKKGAGYVAKNSFSFVASADEWFSPIVAEVGPDGHLWIADWYNFIIQHNPTPSVGRGGYAAQRGRGNAHVNPNRDRQHGRIYRVIWDGAPKSKIKSLAKAKTKQLIAALDSDNLFWRQTAQRLLVDGGHKNAVNALRKRALGQGAGAIHALWTLEGLGALDAETKRTTLISTDPAVKRNAIRALGQTKDDQQLLYDSATLADANLHVRLAAFVKLAQFPKSKTHQRAASVLARDKTNAEDEWLKLALSAAGADQTDIIGYERGPNLLANASFEKAEGNLPADWQVRTYSAKGADVEHAIETRKAYVHSGKSSVKIRSGNGHDTSVYTPVNLKSGTKYALSAWIKTEGVNGGHGALLNIHELQHEAKTKALQKTTDWQKVEIVFDNTQAGPLTVNCLFGGWGQAKGTAWFDDLSLQEVKPIHKKSAEQKEILGQTKRGEDIFHKHAVASCVRCHKVGNEGGVIGPAMDGIASRKDRAYIYESLINPTAQLAEGFDKLGASPMPPMNILLDAQQLADVMAYLMTLKGK